MIPILYQDKDVLVCEKPAGILSQPDALRAGDDMLTLLGEQLRDDGRGGAPYVGLIHRLDRGVGGVMVFSLHPRATGRLSATVADRSMTKQYLAVVHGAPEEPSGIWQNFLYKDASLGKSFAVERMRKGVKQASLAYRTLATATDTPYGTVSLLQIRLHTGRTHQIRVQCSCRGMPLLGDGKYGARDHGVPIGLWSYRLTFAHPTQKGQTVDVCSLPTGRPPFDLFETITPVDDLPGAPLA